MNQIIVLTKMNLRLLLRNKGFLFFLLILPLLSVLLLNLKEGADRSQELFEKKITELADPDTKIIYLAELEDSYYYYRIKVFDSSQSPLTDFVLNQLIDTGLFAVYRYDSSHMSQEEVIEKAKENAFYDRLGTILYITEEFEQDIFAKDILSSIQIFHATEDERKLLLERSLEQNLSLLTQGVEYSKNDSEKLLTLLFEQKESFPQKEISYITADNNLSLTNIQKAYKKNLGYSYAIMTLGFLFCGIFIAHTVIEERENKVYTRIILSNTNNFHYIVSKLLLAMLVSILQTFIAGIGVFVITNNDFGISNGSYLILIFLLGLIFNILSLCVGVIVGNVMGANYVAFSIWTVSSLLSGLYFSIDAVTGIVQKLSGLMPQKWFLQAAEMLMLGNKSAFSMILCITIAYLIIFLSIGAVGLKLKQED